MKKIALSTFLIAFLSVISAFAGGTASEAESLVSKALAHIKASGQEKAFADFTDTKGAFVKDDLYIFVVRFDGITLAHGGNQKIVSKNMKELKDSKGDLFIQKMIDLAKGKGSGWVDYSWTNPQTKQIQPKSSFVQKGEGDYFIGCGIYK